MSDGERSFGHSYVRVIDADENEDDGFKRFAGFFLYDTLTSALEAVELSELYLDYSIIIFFDFLGLKTAISELQLGHQC